MEKVNRQTMLIRGILTIGLTICLFLSGLHSLPVAAASEKKQIGIMNFNDTEIQGTGKAYVKESRVIDLLTNELVSTKSFTVCERDKVTQILNEQALGLSGAVKNSSSDGIGELLGLNYMLFGKVVLAEFENSSDLFSSWTVAKVVLEARLVDVTTGVVVLTASAEGKDEINKIFGSKVPSTEKELLQVYENATSKAVKILTAKINEMNPLHGMVMQADNGKIYIDVGNMQGVRKGDKFKVFREGSLIINPATKAVTGINITDVGIIKVNDVQEKNAIGEIIKTESDGITIQSGDKIKRAM